MTTKPTSTFRIILQAFDPMWTSRVQFELAKLFQIDDATASNIVSAVPIGVFADLDAYEAARVRERMEPLIEAGCKFVTTDEDSDAIPRINWPELPEFARIAVEQLHAERDAPAKEAPAPKPKKGSPRRRSTGSSKRKSTRGEAPKHLLAAFECPSCGEAFHLLAGIPNSRGGLPAGAASALPPPPMPPPTPPPLPTPSFSDPLLLAREATQEEASRGGKPAEGVGKRPVSTGKDSKSSSLAVRAHETASADALEEHTAATTDRRESQVTDEKQSSVFANDQLFDGVDLEDLDEEEIPNLSELDAKTPSELELGTASLLSPVSEEIDAFRAPSSSLFDDDDDDSISLEEIEAAPSRHDQRFTGRESVVESIFDSDDDQLGLPADALFDNAKDKDSQSSPARPKSRKLAPFPSTDDFGLESDEFPIPGSRKGKDVGFLGGPTTPAGRDPFDSGDDFDIKNLAPAKAPDPFDSGDDIDLASLAPAGSKSRDPFDSDDAIDLASLAPAGSKSRDPFDSDDDIDLASLAPAGSKSRDPFDSDDDIDLASLAPAGSKSRDPFDSGDDFEAPSSKPKSRDPFDSGELELGGLEQEVDNSFDEGESLELDASSLTPATSRGGDPFADSDADDELFGIDDEPSTATSKRDPFAAADEAARATREDPFADLDSSGHDPFLASGELEGRRSGVRKEPRSTLADTLASLDDDEDEESDPLFDSGRSSGAAFMRADSGLERFTDEQSEVFRNRDSEEMERNLVAEARGSLFDDDEEEDLELPDLDHAPQRRGAEVDPFESAEIDAPASKGFRKGMPFDDALALFNSSDQEPLDAGSGLFPAQIEIVGRRDLERLEEADMAPLRSVKTVLPAPPPSPSLSFDESGSSADLSDYDPSAMLDILGTDQAARKERRSGRFKRKKSLVPANASDEDLDPFSKRTPSRREKSSARSRRVDPFANARGGNTDKAASNTTKKRERKDPFSSRPRSGSRNRRDPFAADDEISADAPPPAQSGRRKRTAPVEGISAYGLVLSKIIEEPKRRQAAKLIAELQGSTLEEALRLTERTIIPVLKGVSKDKAEQHLERFKSIRISGRVTKRRG